MDIQCLVCRSKFVNYGLDYVCPRCEIPHSIYKNVIDNPEDDYSIVSMLRDGRIVNLITPYNILGDIQRAKLSHYLHKIDFDKSYTEENYRKLRHIISEALDTFKSKDGKPNLKMDNNTIFDLPNPMQQLDRLMLFLGDNNYILGNYLDLKNEMLKENECLRGNVVYYGNHIDEKLKRIAGYIGINEIEDNKSKKIIYHLFEEAESRKWVILTEVSKTTQKISLTIDGYQYYQSLLKNISHSSFGFLAMKFPPYENLLDITPLATYLKSDEIKKATGGFSIHNPLLNEPQAGNITFNMLNHIRDARFMVAELSHHNNGAYWEAGYAFGLGKHVFFMCHKNEWKKTHFDIAQQYIILWTEDTIEEDCKKLADMIKFHFPEVEVQNTYL